MSGRFDNHPNIGSIIRIRDSIVDALHIAHNYESALSIMSGLMEILKPEDQDEELRDSIEDEYFALMDYQSRSKRDKRIKDRRKLYRQWFRDLNKILWDKDYLTNKKYGPDLSLRDKMFEEQRP